MTELLEECEMRGVSIDTQHQSDEDARTQKMAIQNHKTALGVLFKRLLSHWPQEKLGPEVGKGVMPESLGILIESFKPLNLHKPRGLDRVLGE